MAPIHPFQQTNASKLFSRVIETVRSEILDLDDEHVLKTSRTTLEAYYIAKAAFEPLILYPDDAYIINQSGTKIPVSNDVSRGVPMGKRAPLHGSRLEIAIPFKGDPKLWHARPSSYSISGYPPIEVQDEHIVLTFAFPHDAADPERLKSELDKAIQSLNGAVETLRKDVEAHNNAMPQVIKTMLDEKTSAARAAFGAIESLGIPIKRRDEPLVYTVPVKRRKSPLKPKVATERVKLEPVLDEEEYDHILKIMHSMAVVIERNPIAFTGLDEGTIRTHFLLQLNGHYEGTATGETFSIAGDTDILIRANDRNVFIAECKFWHGGGEFKKAIDQLLGYLTWRDSKCALLIFNKKMNTTSVKKEMHALMRAHSGYKRTIFHPVRGDSRYIFVKKSDPEREIMITTQVYDLPESVPRRAISATRLEWEKRHP